MARELDLKMRAGEIEHWERQFKIEMVPCDSTGRPIPKLKVVHYVDFRQHNVDGTFTLVEAKGFETAIWRMKRKWLEQLWLPDHPDHDYIVIKSARVIW